MKRRAIGERPPRLADPHGNRPKPWELEDGPAHLDPLAETHGGTVPRAPIVPMKPSNATPEWGSCQPRHRMTPTAAATAATAAGSTARRAGCARAMKAAGDLFHRQGLASHGAVQTPPWATGGAYCPVPGWAAWSRIADEGRLPDAEHQSYGRVGSLKVVRVQGGEAL